MLNKGQQIGLLWTTHHFCLLIQLAQKYGQIICYVILTYGTLSSFLVDFFFKIIPSIGRDPRPSSL